VRNTLIKARVIRIGNQTAFSARTPVEPFQYALAQGFDAFEWFPDKKESGEGWDIGDLDSEARRIIKEEALAHDLSMSLHAPWHANPLREENSRMLQGYLEFAREIGASLINIHLHTEEGIEAYVKAIVPLIKRTAEAGLRLSMENTPLTSPEDFNRLFFMLHGLEDVETGHVGMCLDVGHANLCSSTRNDYLGFVDRLDPGVPIIHVHMHENYGDRDSHLPLFTGPAGENPEGIRGLMERLKGRGFKGSIILEQWPEPRWLLDQARERLSRMLEISGTGEARPSEPERAVPVVERKEPEPEGVRSGGGDFAQVLSEADRRHPSWKQKLELVHELLKGKPGLDKLVYISIYLRFLSTGAVACSEDGRHFRPSHHARLAQRVEKDLAGVKTLENAFVLKKIYPYLPSHDSAFLRAEPLTRIRDIAHRNDIPKELKSEIKHTLQNKLHRCAGPGDLATSRAILERVTAPGADYSPAFVREFRVFHEQLKEFFNARSLDERLTALAGKGDKREAGRINKFLDSKDDETPDGMLGTLQSLTELRGGFVHKADAGISAEAQQYRLADIGLEDYAFVLLSRLINKMDFSGNWQWPLRALALAVANMRLSGLDPAECAAVENELNTMLPAFDPKEREHLLRLKASLDRCRRLADGYAERVLALFPEKAEALGRALGVGEHAIKAFTEGDIRGSIVFQLSKLVSGALKAVRARAGLPPWDALVTGSASGRVVAGRNLGDIRGQEQPLIALITHVEGDEDVPKGVRGVLLSHELPHLSHFSVRARQQGVVLASCEDEGEWEKMEGLRGEHVTLHVRADGVEVQAAPMGTESDMPRRRPVQIPEVSLASKNRVLTLDKVTMANSGGKAYGLRRLEELKRGFKTLPARVVPFGVMEEALRAMGLEEEYLGFIEGLEDKYDSDDPEILGRLRALAGCLEVPPEVLEGIGKAFGKTHRLAVRSSASAEDLKGLAGAGLYHTVVNVTPDDADHAISRVWASLWTEQAVRARGQAGIPHKKAHMAVIIQKMLVPEYSFIMHTVNPVTLDHKEAYLELAPGMGETLASGTEPGGPYKMAVDKETGEARLGAFASFSHYISTSGGGGIEQMTVDYSALRLSFDRGFREALASRLAALGKYMEEALGGPQDMEGGIFGDDIYLLQCRPEQGV
jgi:phosphoglucan,water dikinase